MAANPDDLVALNQALASDPEYQQLLTLKEHSSIKGPKLVARARALAGGSLPKGAVVNGNTGQVVPDHFWRNGLIQGAAMLGGGALAGAAMGGGAAAAGAGTSAATTAGTGAATAGGSTLSTILGGASAAGKIAQGAMAGRSAGRAQDAAYQASQDQRNLQRLDVPTIQAGQAYRGDLLANYKPYVGNVPGVNAGTATGGTANAIGDNTRQAGAALSAQALSDLLAGKNHTATDVPGPGKLDKALGWMSLLGTGIGAVDAFRGSPEPSVMPQARQSLVTSPENLALLGNGAPKKQPGLRF